MKTFLGVAVLCTLAAFAFNIQAVTTVTVTPVAVSNTYAGTITLQVSGLANGETVFVQKFVDANANGVVDAGDVLFQAFSLTDGQANVFHDGTTSVTNTLVPGDLDSVSGQITAALNLRVSGFEQTMSGHYLFVVSSTTGSFSPQTNSFMITNFPFAQSLSGSVIASGTNVPGAAVLLFQPVGQNLNPQGGAIADNSGNYLITAPPGSYVLVAFKSNFVANAGAASVSLGSGVNLSTNLFLLPSDRTISGSILDASNAAVGLPGALIPVESQGGLLTVAFTDTNGNFRAGVTADQWQIQVSDQAATFHGYLREQNNKMQVDTTGGSVSGATVSLVKANAIFYGTVKDGSNQPVPSVSLFSQDNNNSLEQDTTGDVNGNYFVGAVGMPGVQWQLEVSNDGNPTNYVFSQPAFDGFPDNGTNLTAGQAVRYDFIALLATNQITGHVQDSTNQPVIGAQVVATATINGANFQTQADTDDNGNYALNVPNGLWTVSVTCQGGNDSLDAIFGNGNYLCPGGTNVTASGNNPVANFTIMPCGGIQVLTPSTLPNGQAGNFYSMQLEASSCNDTFTWSLQSGSLPPGLTFLSGGGLNGTPTTSGTFNFTAHVQDGSGASTNQNYSITIEAPQTTVLLGQPSKSGSQFQFQMSVSTPGVNYTVQATTNLKSTNWSTLLITNPSQRTFFIQDPSATNPARYYRVLGP
ncbi:MAG TPA: carboxypeptidase regulatory-like domain-containing protein [Candidatus Angelobacter sp.]|nr:carboxypeptidase regulatory-like domain-containing protein [Candidatus Angelobacter sp.]